ncbi:MAG: RraA family protein [Candidatus Hodarchaeota archaeon]
MDEKTRKELLEAYEDLRVADVRDGMDTLMLHHYGSMDPSIRPIFRTRAFGIAKTVRYLPFTGPIPHNDPKGYKRWTMKYYGTICTYWWLVDIEEGDFIVIDQSGVNAGLMGSENSLSGMIRGARGYVTNGGVRDTDEIILQKVPFWSAMISQTMVQGRLQFDAHDIPVSVGGVTVHPGDMVVADGDGVIVVPQDVALEVAKYAHEIHDSDKKTRRSHYKVLGIKPDDTV